MLALTRKVNESVIITTRYGEVITITVVDVGTNRTRLGFDAPADIKIMRKEIADQPPKS